MPHFLPEKLNGKRPAYLGQKEGKLKKLAGSFPITTVQPAGDFLKWNPGNSDSLGLQVFLL